MVTIHVISDLHLEVQKNPTKLYERVLSKQAINRINNTGDNIKNYKSNYDNSVLILAGDIDQISSSVYKEFLTQASKLYDLVLVVLGNHEFYGSSIDKVHAFIESMVLPPNVHILNRQVIEYKNIRFLGCTLWAHSEPGLEQLINDFNSIENLDSSKYNSMNKQDTDWLTSELSINTGMKTVVITHHIPSRQLVNKIYKNHPANTYYVNDLDHLLERADMWVCGHTHIPLVKYVGKCLCVINPYGYGNETTKCDINKRITLTQTSWSIFW